MDDKDKIEELINNSSFGTDEAKLLIGRVPKEVVDAIVEKVRKQQEGNK